MKNGNSCFATRLLLWSFSVLFFGALFAGNSFAWVYPEYFDMFRLNAPTEAVINMNGKPGDIEKVK